MADRITTSSKLSSPLGSLKYLSQTSVTDTAGNVRKKQRLRGAGWLPLLLHFLPGNHVDGKNWCEMDSEKQRIESGQSAKLVIRFS